METLVRSPADSDNHHTEISGMPTPEAQPPPEKADASSLPFAAGPKPHLIYKCLLYQHAQKLRKDFPIFQTNNEGSAHTPKYRSTVWFDGMSYASSNTFQQRKTAEMDVSKTAYFSVMQKLKNDALQLILKDKTFCKSILIEYAAKMNMGKPTYETAQLDTVPHFRSSLVLNGVTYQGDSAKNKKEAEQLAAHAAILKYLDSESGNDLPEIINCKFRPNVDMNKVLEINSFHNDTSVVGTQMIVDNAIGINETKPELGTTTMRDSSAFPPPIVTQPPIPQVSNEAITPAAVLGPTVLTQTPSAEINNSSLSSLVSTTPSFGQFASIPAPCLSSNVIQPINSFPLGSQVLQHLPFVGQTSGKKRNRKNKKKALKKMRVDTPQMPIPAVTSAVPPCSSQ